MDVEVLPKPCEYIRSEPIRSCACARSASVQEDCADRGPWVGVQVELEVDSNRRSVGMLAVKRHRECAARGPEGLRLGWTLNPNNVWRGSCPRARCVRTPRKRATRGQTQRVVRERFDVLSSILRSDLRWGCEWHRVLRAGCREKSKDCNQDTG